MSSLLHNPAWDRPGDKRSGPFPQSPTQLDLSGLVGEHGPGGLSLYNRALSLGPWVKPTSATPQTISLVGGGTVSGYPALFQSFDGVAGAWVDGIVCWFLGANGETPSSGKRYLVALAAFDASGVPIYSTEVGGSGGGPQPTLDLTLASASNSDVGVGDLSKGYKWVRVASTPASPTTIDGFAGGVDGALIEVTNCTTNDLHVADAARSGSAAANQILVPEFSPPAGNTGEPYYRTLHERESLFLKYDGTAQKWRVLERLTHLLVGTTPNTGTEYARGRIQLIPACHMSISAVDDPTTDTVQTTIGTNGKTATYTVTAGDVLTFVCGQLTAINGV